MLLDLVRDDIDARHAEGWRLPGDDELLAGLDQFQATLLGWWLSNREPLHQALMVIGDRLVADLRDEEAQRR